MLFAFVRRFPSSSVFSQVSPQWHRWLHYQSDEVPSAAEVEYVFRTPHRPNLTGTQRAYRPSGYLFQTHVKVSRWHWLRD